MGTSAEDWLEESCVICKGRVFSGGRSSSEKRICVECRSVFAELVSSNKAFSCSERGCCPLTRLSRYHCLYCFVKRCLWSGFGQGCIWHQGLNNTGSFAPAHNPSSEAAQIIVVEIDFGERRPSYIESSSEEDDLESSDSDNASSNIFNTICRVGFSHMKFCPTTAEKMKLKPSPPSTGSVDLDRLADDELLVPESSDDSRRSAIFRKLAENMNSAVVAVAEFLRRLPGYESVSMAEKMKLLKEGFFRVWLLWNVPGFIGSSRQRLILNGNVCLSFSELSDVYSVEFVRRMFEFARNWSSLGLKDTEVGICAGIVLSTISNTTGAAWDRSRRIIEGTNEILRRALRQLLVQNNPTKPNLAEYVLQLISALDSISCAHGKLLQRFHDGWQRLGIPPLFAEVFQFSRTDESGKEMASSTELDSDNEDMLCDDAGEINGEMVGLQSDLSNHIEDESCSELGNLGDVSCSDLASNVSESEIELGNCGEASQSDLCTVEEILRGELIKDGEIFRDVVNEDAFSVELNEFNIFHRGLLSSQDEDIFQDRLSKDILSDEEMTFRNDLIKDVVHIGLSEDVVCASESKDVEEVHMEFIEHNST